MAIWQWVVTSIREWAQTDHFTFMLDALGAIYIITSRHSKWLPTITHKGSKTNSSFYVKQRATGKVYFLFFKSFLLVLKKHSFWQGYWALGYNSMAFRQFLDIF